MPRMDGLWLMNKKDNKQVALFMIVFWMLEGFIGMFTFAGIDIFGYGSVLFRIYTIFMLVWIGVGLWKRKLAAV